MATLPIDVKAFYESLTEEQKIQVFSPIVIDLGVDEELNNDNLSTELTFSELVWADLCKKVSSIVLVKKYSIVEGTKVVKYKWYKSLNADDNTFVNIATYEAEDKIKTIKELVTIDEGGNEVTTPNPDYDPDVISEYAFFRLIASMPVPDDMLVKVFAMIGYNKGAFISNV